MAEVYWIHLPEHTDMFSEGYIGVTRHDVKHRFTQHVQEANRREYAKWHFTRAIKKYGQSLVAETLVVAEEEYCYELELKLRPQNFIGWNMAAGGQRPIRNPDSYGDVWKQKLREHNLGKEHGQETLNKLSVLSKSWWANEDYQAKMLVATQANKVSEVVENGFWKRSTKKNRVLPIADVLYKAYYEYPNLFMPQILEILNLDESYLQPFRRIARKFRGGWNPHEDPLWLDQFKKEGDCGPSTTKN